MRSIAIVPAAGRGERFRASSPSDTVMKLLVDIEGAPLLDRTIHALIGGGVDAVVVVLAPGSVVSAATVSALRDPRVRSVVNPDPGRGMLSSIQAGVVDAEADADVVLIHPGDMPFVRSETVAAVLAACRRSREMVSPRIAGRRGHPLALPARLREVILSAPPHAALNDVLKAFTSRRIELEVTDGGILRDVDTIGDIC
jgi:molybdenum cofactor cytidylyltransferase